MKRIIFIALLIISYLPASLLAAEKTMTTYTWDRNIKVTSGSATGTQALPPITDPGITTQFPPIVNNPSSPSITVDPVTGAIAMGSGINDGSGSIWYGGTSPSGTCNPCTNGVCVFGVGLRAYFEFKYITMDASTNSNANADGFTFTVMNAEKNNISKRGGFPNTSETLGELMGYAGPGNTTSASSLPLDKVLPLDGLGLEPPKFAIEFDTYPNPNAMQDNGCSGNRNDHNNNNHIALMFWGSNPSSTTMCDRYSTAGRNYPQASFDDNVHGAGDGTTSNPYNSSYSGNGSGLGGYYERARSTYNWLEDGQNHRVRMEVNRTSATQTYQVKAWVDCESCSSSPCTACPANEYIYFQDVYHPYTNSSYPPKIDRTQQLTAALNTSLNQILFGFTEGTGASTQKMEIKNFVIYFPTSSISPTSRAHTYSAASGQIVSVTTASTTCTWKANSYSSWITVTNDDVSMTGSGTVMYSVAANTGAARTGTITIGGQLFTVTQDAGPPTCTLTAGSSIVSYSGTTDLSWTVSGTATSATWTTSPGGTCASPNPAGASCTTAVQTTAGARTYTLNVTNAYGSSSCATIVYVGCAGYRAWNNTGATRDFRVTGQACRTDRTNGSEITTSTASTQLQPGETISRYTTAGSGCSSAVQGSIDYTAAMNADIVPNGGNGDCRVNYNSGDTISDR
ncbi:MAG: BACON domain-containing protein [Smithellaceae bacterium]